MARSANSNSPTTIDSGRRIRFRLLLSIVVGEFEFADRSWLFKNHFFLGVKRPPPKSMKQQLFRRVPIKHIKRNEHTHISHICICMGKVYRITCTQVSIQCQNTLATRRDGACALGFLDVVMWGWVCVTPRAWPLGWQTLSSNLKRYIELLPLNLYSQMPSTSSPENPTRIGSKQIPKPTHS